MKRMIIGVMGVFLLIQTMWAQTWQGTKRLTWNTGVSYSPSIAVGSNGHIHLVWEDSSPGNYEIYYKRSTNGGTTWATKRMTYSVSNSSFPDVAVDSSGQVHVVWNDASPQNWEVFYRKSTDGGATWEGTERLTWNAGDSYNPAIDVGPGNRVNVVWSDDTPGNYEIYYKGREGGNLLWDSTKRLTWNSESSIQPAIAADSANDLHVTWMDDFNDGNFEIYYKRSTDGGSTWSKYERLTQNLGASGYPELEVDSSGTIHVVWYDLTFIVSEIFYGRSTNGGGTWDYARRLTWNAGKSEFPAVALDSNLRAHVVWQDNSPGNFEIYYKRSTYGGSTWSKYRRLSWNSGSSYFPDITVDSSGFIHIVWSDFSTGAPEIYYKKGIQ